jgi:uncharacterized protein (DUF1330 family)
MPAYIIVSIDIHDVEAMKAYSARVPPVIKAFGGRYLARGEPTTTLEGEFPLSKITILEFPSLEAAHSFWNSAEYKECKALREKCSSGRAALLAGSPGEAPTPGHLRGQSGS